MLVLLKYKIPFDKLLQMSQNIYSMSKSSPYNNYLKVTKVSNITASFSLAAGIVNIRNRKT